MTSATAFANDNSQQSPEEVGRLYYHALALIGPFRTKRAALWAEKYGRANPHFQHVNDAERLSRGVS